MYKAVLKNIYCNVLSRMKEDNRTALDFYPRSLASKASQSQQNKSSCTDHTIPLYAKGKETANSASQKGRVVVFPC